jgi:hypothetical protein
MSKKLEILNVFIDTEYFVASNFTFGSTAFARLAKAKTQYTTKRQGRGHRKVA